jgi:beta-glucanase (GH16 family)
MRPITLALALAAAVAFPALGQEPAPKTPAAEQATAIAMNDSIMLTSEQANNWVGKPVYSSDGKNVGEIAAFARGTDNKVSEMHADIGGFLGFGTTRVRVMSARFKLAGDRVTIDMTAEQAKDLPRV